MERSWVIVLIVVFAAGFVVLTSLSIGPGGRRSRSDVPDLRRSRSGPLWTMKLFGSLLMAAGGAVGLITALTRH